jgi:CheY-like chemotaxis protein
MARILVVDDEELVRGSIAGVLRRAGHAVTTAEDGEDALGKFQPNRFDLVITDIVMPRMEGIETMRALRRLEPAIRVIAMSGGDAGDDGFYLKAALALGADATLQKPFRVAELQQLVAEALAISPAESAALWYRQMPDWVPPLANQPPGHVRLERGQVLCAEIVDVARRRQANRRRIGREPDRALKLAAGFDIQKPVNEPRNK